MPTVTLTIDGKSVTALKGAMLLDVCRENGIPVPTLCHHQAIGADGRCRLCVVELREGDWFKLVTSCLYPVKEGLNILTGSPRVRKTRGMILELLLARCPSAEEIKTLAAEYGVTKPRFEPDDDKGKCILCGMCVRTCGEVIGQSAISYLDRGINKQVGTPYLEAAKACIGCGACAAVCPTGHIELTEKNNVRKIDLWKVSFPLVACRECGKGITTREHIDYLKKRAPLPGYIYELCEDCKRRFYMEKTLSLGHM